LLVWLMLIASAFAQPVIPLDAPDLDLKQEGYVHAIVRHPDGGFIVGGSFDFINGVPRNNLARFTSTGELDMDWNPSPDNTVWALAVDANGAIYVGGGSFFMDGQPRGPVVKLLSDETGSLDTTWNPQISAPSYVSVGALAVAADGSIYVGGDFSQVGGLSRNRLAKIFGSGAVDPDWDPSANDDVETLAVDADGSVYVGGYFTEIDGLSRSRIAKLSGNGSGTVVSDWNPSANSGRVASIVVNDGSSLFVGGTFRQIGGQSRRYIAKLATSGAGDADPDWNPLFESGGSPVPGGGVYSLALDAAGDVYAGGSFGDVGGLSREYIAKLSGTGTGAADANWNPSANGYISALGIDANGNVYAGGSFSQIGGQPRASLARIDTNGLALSALHAEQPGRVKSLALQPDGGLIVGGKYWQANGLSRRNLLRLTPDRQLDMAWNPTIENNLSIDSVASDSAGAVFIAGNFSFVDGLYRDGIAKLAGSGAGQVDPTWYPGGVSGSVNVMALGDNDTLYLGGNFSQIGAQSRSRLARVSQSGSGVVDPDWNPSANGQVSALAIAEDGSVFIGGTFTQVGGLPRNRIAKLDGVGTGDVDPDWNPNADGEVKALAVATDGSLIASGAYYEIGGQPANGIAKLAGGGSGDVFPGWDVGGSLLNASALALDVEGRVYAASSFGMSRRSTADGPSTGDYWGTSLSDTGFHDRVLLVDDANDLVYVGGDISSVSGQQRLGLAALPKSLPASDESRLSALVASEGTLSPSFHPDTLSYGMTVSNAVAALTFTPTALDDGASIVISGLSIASGVSTSPLPLNVGDNPVSIVVTAEDGISQREYTVNVVRLSSQPAALSIRIERLPDGTGAGGVEVRQYRITVLNVGTMPAADVSLAIPAPSGMTNLAWTCDAPEGCTPGAGENGVAAVFNLAPGAAAQVELIGDVLPEAPFVDIDVQASTASSGGAQASQSISEAANGIGVLKSGFE